MKKILLYSTALVALLFAACSKSDVEMPTPSLQIGEGAVRFNISANNEDSEGADVYNPLDYCTIRIYSADGLIRKYNSQAEMPETLSLLAGSYSIDVELGDMSPATWTNKSYHGESSFTVEAGKNVEVKVACEPLNATVVVEYDESVAENLTDFSTTVAMGESSLVYEATQTGYFLPVAEEGEAVKLAWNFAGTHAEQGALTQSGEFEIEAAKKYTLKLKYTPTATGFLSFEIVVDEPTATDDVIIFSPEPVFKGEAFDLAEEQPFFGTTKTINLTAQSDLKALSMELEGETYDLVNETVAGVTLTQTDSKNWVITLTDELLSAYPGGLHTVKFVAKDADDVEGKNSALLISQGIVPGVADVDLWANTGKVQVMIFDENVQSVEVKVRRVGGEWKTITATKQADSFAGVGGGVIYSALVEPEWTTETNSKGLEVYKPNTNTGIFANASYEAKAVIDGVEKAAVADFSTSVSQSIPYGDFEDSGLSCFTAANSSTIFWGSGNNPYKQGLCAQGTKAGMGGNACAVLNSSATLGVLASGNLFTGNFNMVGMAGTVSFGHDYSWVARPSALRLKLHATVGKADIASYVDETGNLPLNVGDQDIARVYALIVDWSARPDVTSGTSKPTGCFDPSAVKSLEGCGNIIACASLLIDKSTEGDSMVTVEIPFEFYDKVTKPTSAYKIVLSAANSTYGDYMCGCSSNVMYVDDFEWVY